MRSASATATCALCATNRFCAVPFRLSSGASVRCTRNPGHSGEHAACGVKAGEHPILRWTGRPAVKLQR